MLEQLREAGVSIRAERGRLIIEAPPGVVTPEARGEMVRLKPELLSALEVESDRTPGVPWNAAESEPAKPLEPGSEVAPAEPDQAELARANAVLSRAGVRLMVLEGTVGVWSDLDGPNVRAALRVFGTDRSHVRYLDSHGIPARYKERRVDGEAVPLSVLKAMEREPESPWTVRDRMPESNAARLNRLFQEQGTSGRPGRITAATIQNGERKPGSK